MALVGSLVVTLSAQTTDFEGNLVKARQTLKATGDDVGKLMQTFGQLGQSVTQSGQQLTSGAQQIRAIGQQAQQTQQQMTLMGTAVGKMSASLGDLVKMSLGAGLAL